MTLHFPDGTSLALTNGGLFFAAVVVLAASLLAGNVVGVLADLYREAHERKERRYDRRRGSAAAGGEDE